MAMRMVMTIAVMLAARSVCSAEVLTYVDLVKRLTDPERLAVLPEAGEVCAQWSSWDRASRYDKETDKYVNWDANGDNNGCIRKEGESIVMAEMDGPGCIWRIWSAAPKAGHVRIYLDGAAEPAVDLPFSGYFDGTNAPFTYPSLVHDAASGKNCYVPIPFAKSCKVVADPGWGDYYHFTYSLFPKDTEVPTFKRDLTAEQEDALASVHRHLRHRLGPYSGVRYGLDRDTPKQVSAQPGETASVAELEGSGAIRQFKVRLDQAKYSEGDLRHVILRMYWDGEKEPSVWVPLGDFFGTGPGMNLYRSLPLGVTADGLYCHWYMPFAKGALIEIENMGTSLFEGTFDIVRAPLSRSIATLGRFHAKWHRDAFLPTEAERWIDWPMLKTEGRGRFCGVALEIWNPKGGWWGEGDEKFFVDGEAFPSTFGTGSEDYFGYAWGNPTLFENAYHNQPRSDGNAGHISVNRWHITDNVPFQRSFEGCIEKYYKNDRPTLYACTAYWYQAPGGKDPYKGVGKEDLIFYVKPAE